MAESISVVRGTTDTINVNLTDGDGNAYFLGDGEELIFCVKRNHAAKTYLIHNVLTAADAVNGVYPFQLKPADTRDLAEGPYYYGVAIQSGSDLFPVVACENFSVIACIPKLEAD